MTIVQEQNISGSQVAGKADKRRVRIATARVVTASSPARQTHAERVEHRRKKRIAQTCKGTEKLRSLPGDFFQCNLRVAYFPHPAVQAKDGRVFPMTLAVIFDGMAGGDDLATKLGMGCGPLANAKEIRLYAMRGENGQDLRRYFRIGAVIERDGDLPALHCGLRQAHEIPPQQRAARPQACGSDNGVIQQHRTQRPAPELKFKQESQHCPGVQESGEDKEWSGAPGIHPQIILASPEILQARIISRTMLKLS